eukprot:TRINITY_DN73318_c0_g1_i1.p1 TRINITY_DN73318_c0_g1~~TRINITY_DN73318_c0_g1_i1.p1  ORF type:complete len:592 (+),score=42.49 TRINITY_DN73318_c0_g1_i1:181-1956(+)
MLWTGPGPVTAEKLGRPERGKAEDDDAALRECPVMDVDGMPPGNYGHTGTVVILQEEAGPLAHQLIADERTRLSEHVDRNPDLFRGIRASTLLDWGAAWIRSGPILGADANGPKTEEAGNKMYAQSLPVSRLTQFLSHSWHANSKIKALSLLSYYNGSFGLLCGIALVAIVAVLKTASILPPWNSDMPNEVLRVWAPGQPPRVAYAGWFSATFSATYFVVLLLGRRPVERVWRTSNRWTCCCSWRGDEELALFFDKLCIHQTDMEKKVLGIKSIGAFLINCDEMVIAWDKSYFSRVWCVFEISIFLHLNPAGRIRFLPNALGALELIAAVSFSLSLMVISVAMTLELPQPAFARLADVCDGLVIPRTAVCFGFLPLAWPFQFIYVTYLRNYYRDHRAIMDQLRAFSAEKADSFSPDDKVFVLELIEKLYGSVDVFDDSVRRELLCLVRRELGSQEGLPYRIPLRAMSLPAFAFLMDAFWGFGFPNGWLRQLHLLGQILTLSMLQLPTVMQVMARMSRVGLSVTSKWGERVLVVALSLFTSVMTLGWNMSWRQTFSPDVNASIITTIISVFALLLANAETVNERLRACFAKS